MLRHIALPVLFLFLPIYFSNPSGIYIPFFCAVLLILAYIVGSKFHKTLLLLMGCLLGFATVQLSCLNSIVNLSFFLNRFIAVGIFIFVFEIVRHNFQIEHLKYLMYSFYFVVFYSIYAAFSIPLHYERFLIPGTSSVGNLTPIGTLRCGTFGEGNYLGGYCALIALVFARKLRFLLIVLIPTVISFSPIPLLLVSFLILHIHFIYPRIKKKNIKKFYMLMGIPLFILGLFFLPSYLRESANNYLNAAEYNLKTSFVERTDFIISGLSMWWTSPIIGLGLGQYPVNLSEHATLPHLILNVEDYRYIANNNFAEILSEMGGIGIFFYFYILRKTNNEFLKNRYVSVTLYVCFLGMTMPTFFQVVVAGILGILASSGFQSVASIED